MSGAFMGVEPDTLQAIGRVVVAAGRTEWVLALIANEVGVAKPTAASSQVIASIRAALRSFPSRSPLRSEVEAWLDGLPPLLEVRHEAIHVVHMKGGIAADGKLVSPIALIMRKRERKAVAPVKLEEVAEALADASAIGMRLFGELHIASIEGRSGPKE